MSSGIALNRFGLGARLDEPPPTGDPKTWLLGQFERFEARPAAWAATPATAEIAAKLVDERPALRPAVATQAGQDPQDVQKARAQMRQENQELYRQAVTARMASALVTSTPFVERLVHFWANHFAVSADKQQVVPYAGAFEAEAIRPHVLGRFEDLLIAAERHAAMMLYLDQARSFGPNSTLGVRVAERTPQRKLGLNENLAREILELHTLGVRTGYTQADVTEFARALTGWTIGDVRAGAGGQGPKAGPGDYVFRSALHEPGARTLLGRTYNQQGERQALAILHDLATAKATADHIAFKLARHFTADEPAPSLVTKLSAAFMRSGGDLPTVYRALVEAPESWEPTPRKFKTPWEWLVSAMRGVGVRDAEPFRIAPVMQQLGQPVWRPGSPAGYDDIAASWAAPDALVRRVEYSQRVGARIGDRIDPRTLSQRLFQDALSPATATAISRADSGPTGIALLLVSPDFQRR